MGKYEHRRLNRLHIYTFVIVSQKIINVTGFFSLPNIGEITMAVNKPYGDNRRIGAVKERSQCYNPVNSCYIKRDRDTGRFMDVKSDGTPFKGVRKEK